MAILNANTTINGNAISTANNVNPDPIFPIETKTVFIQSYAPTGWVKLVDNDDCTLRVVSGNTSIGGTLGFTTVFSETVEVSIEGDDHTLTTAQMPSHTHSNTPSHDLIYHSVPYYDRQNVYPGYGFQPWAYGSTTSTGGGGSHSHSGTSNIDFSIAYVDSIMAEKQ